MSAQFGTPTNHNRFRWEGGKIIYDSGGSDFLGPGVVFHEFETFRGNMEPVDEYGKCEEVTGKSHGCRRKVFEELFELRENINVKGDFFC